jgi:hypothetical protein
MKVSNKFDNLKSRHVIFPSSFESIIKNILITTVSAYLSWNSGVAYKNSRPGWVSNKYLNNCLKSSPWIYFGSFCAIILNVLILASCISNSRLKKVMKFYLGIFSAFSSSFSDFLTYSNIIFLNMVGTLQRSLIMYSKSSNFTPSGLPSKAFSIPSSLSYFCYLVIGLPSL